MSWRTPFYDEIVQLVGDAAARTLVQVYRGGRIYVPSRPNAKHPLSTLLGIHLARKLSEGYGGEFIEIPTGAALTLQARNDEILRLHRTGKTVQEIARQYQLGARYVWRIIASTRGQVRG